MDNKDCTNASYEYYIPMGKVGGLVIEAPVILSNLKINIPLKASINLNVLNLNFKTLDNKVFIYKPKIVEKNKLFLNGYIIKHLIYSNEINDKKLNNKFNLKIPFKETIPIDFSQFPMYKAVDDECCYTRKTEPISFKIESIKTCNDIIEFNKPGYVSNLTLVIQLSLIQIQNVFIPEPEGDVKLIPSDIQCPEKKDCDNEDFYYTLGYNKNIGLIANKNIFII